MASTQVRLGKQKSGNTDAFGIADAIELSGHRSVRTFEALYNIPDVILSSSGNNADNDALGQLWYVISKKKHYQLVDWSNRHKADGWQVFNSGGDTAALETRITALETSYANLLKKITELEERINGMVQPIPITNIVLDYQQMLFSNYTPQTITATITPANATEKLTWEVNNSNVVITPSDDTLSCEVLPAIGALDGEYLLTVSSSLVSEPVRITFNGVEQDVVEPTVTLRGATSAEAGDEVTITASVQNGVGDGYYKWMVSGNATIKTQAEEQCVIVINDDAAEGDEVVVSYEINDTNGDGIPFDHKITVAASEVEVTSIALEGSKNSITSKDDTITVYAILFPNTAPQVIDKWIFSDPTSFEITGQTDNSITFKFIGEENKDYTVNAERNGVVSTSGFVFNVSIQEPEVVVSIKTVPAGITTAKVGDTITFESTIENPTPDNRGGWNVEGVNVDGVYDETHRYVTLSDDSATGAKITIGEGAQPGGVFDVVHGREGRYTTTVEARHRITIVEESAEITDLDMGGASTNATSVIDLGNASTTATSVINLGNANV